MKNYNDFKHEIVPHIANLCSMRGMYPDILLMKDGIKPRNLEEKRIIDETNFRYGHQGASCLVGDYLLIIDVPEGKTGYQFRFSVNLLYDAYRDGAWEVVDRIVLNDLQKLEKLDHSILRNLKDYSMVKNKLLLCMRNAKRFNTQDSGFVFRRIDDMVMVLYVALKDNGPENRAITPMSRSIAETWGVSDDDVFSAALANTMRLSPPLIKLQLSACQLTDIGKPYQVSAQIPDSALVTTESAVDGAVAMFYAGMQERLSELMRGDFFAVFSGKDECHIHPVDRIPVRGLKALLDNVNRTYPDSMLTQHVFRYDAKRKELKKAL